MIGQWETATFI
ncbi:Protein of unknown function [Lactobacillus helveticus CIRM-BIA 104]|uniref:Uncharacterized protein n=1 Tax=Lactobacillus helveticus CIRM-BIA 104 TaxID=1226333 RepID=U6FCV8_LACHE|nr:Protein of unknown function [Lactobacillus helveticus CIRM-BIA 104]